MKIPFFKSKSTKNKAKFNLHTTMQKAKLYHIITLGCQMNKSDSERISAIFDEYNCLPTNDPQEADFIVFNTCSVKQSAENSVYSQAKNLQKLKANNPNLKVIITGCMVPRKEAVEKTSNVDLVIDIKDLPLLPEKLGLGKGEPIKAARDYFSIAPKYSNSFQVFIPIGTGCNNFCTFCVVPYTRGREYSRPIDDIIKEVKNAVGSGAKEIYLLGQNVNSYEYGFSELLRQINTIDGDFWVRFVSSNPQDMTTELLDVVANSEKMCKYIHFAVQSGNDRILKKMNRRHTIKEYLELCEYMKMKMPNMGISTDMIIGFPSETEEEFNESAELMKTVKFDMAYISQYSPRTGTPAFRMKDDVSIAQKDRRDKVLTEILKQTAKENAESLIGKEVKVLVDKIGRRGSLLGKETGYRTVKINNSLDKNLIGKFVTVRITDAFGFGVEGDLIKVYE